MSYVTLKDGRKIRIPSDEEDAAITAAALSDPDCPPMTDAQLARLRPAREVLPPALYASLTDKSKPVTITLVTDDEDRARKKRMGRPPIESPKVPIHIRLSQNVLDAFKATGKGWQTRIDAVLREAVEQGRV